jgi:valyl-tRNA synthetase
MYDQLALEKKWQDYWAENKIYRYDRESDKPVYSIDNPPRYASGSLHAGHAVHYTHIDFAARYHRMTGYNVIFPLCFDVNGIPIEERVERLHGVSPRDIGRVEFNKLCAEFAEKNIKGMIQQFRMLGESMDDTYYYQTNAPNYRRLTQISFVKLYEQGLMYKGEFPINWCTRCQTALADAECEHSNRMTKLNYIKFHLAEDPSQYVLVATTRPELLSTCQIVAVHPEDETKKHLVGKKLLTPIFKKEVEIIADDKVEPDFGTGVVMICTIGDKDDLEWVYRYKLPVEKGIDEVGNLTALAGKYEGMSAMDGRKAMLEDMKATDLLVKQEDLEQSVGGCWRCKTPLEFLVKEQWFLKTTLFKEKVWEAANKMDWYPEFMKIRLKEWIDSLEWDWVVSRQRFFATPIPVWECENGHVIPATEEQCYIDPTLEAPPLSSCPECDSTTFTGCEDVFDTWMDSSLSPLFLARWQQEADYPGDFEKLFPISLRPQAHDIIRTWAFYTILRSELLTHQPPFREIMMDGFILSEDGTPMHTSLGNVIDPIKVLDEYGADALRYYAATCSLGMDNAFRFKDIKRGTRILRKYWNIQSFIANALKRSGVPLEEISKLSIDSLSDELGTVDRWILSRYSTVMKEASEHMKVFQFDRAMKGIENFMWHEFADNYIEMVKQRVYSRGDRGAAFSLYTIGYGLTRALATYFPHITEEIFHAHYQELEGGESIHRKDFPVEILGDENAETTGSLVKDIIVGIRNWKSESGLPLNSELSSVEIVGGSQMAKNVSAEGQTLKDAMAIIDLTFSETTDLHEEVVGVKPVHAKIGPTFRQNAKAILAYLGKADPAELASKLEAGGSISVPFPEGESGELTKEFIEVQTALVAHGQAVETLKIGELVAIIRK